MEVANRVLLVEDEAPLRRSLENFLKQAGYAFESCSTARDALLQVERFRPDIVIVEYHLPDADGAALLEQTLRLAPHVSTIVISEYDFEAVSSELLRAEVDCFLKKPFDVVEWETALSSACSKARTWWLRDSDLTAEPAC